MTPPASKAITVEISGAARGSRWLSVRRVGHTTFPVTTDMFVDVPRLDWTRFGDTLRADVRCTTPVEGLTARLYVVGPDGIEAKGPDTPVQGDWTTITWRAGGALNDVKRMGVRYQLPERYFSRVGLDNVRVGAAAALNNAWSVAVGPFETRDDAVKAIPGLKASKISSFPVFVEGWYLNVGTFSSATAARAESKRLAAVGIKTVVVER